MIKKIKKISNLGIFSNFIWQNNLPNFKKFNLFYGWNASGKTTLTEIFVNLNRDESKKFSNLQYQIEMEDGSIIEQDEIWEAQVRVFNQDYIENNISLSTGKTKPIFLLGVDSKELEEKIKDWEDKLEVLNDLQKALILEKNKIQKGKDDKFTNIARIIGENLTGSSVRNYRRNNAKDDFNKLVSKELLISEELSKQQKIRQQIEKPKILKIVFDFNLSNEVKKVKDICKKIIDVQIIERLKNNPDIYKWVEEGLSIHKKHESSSCEFCGQQLPNNLIQNLELFFNEEDRKLKWAIKEKIKFLSGKLTELERIELPKKNDFYDDLHTVFESRIEDLNRQKVGLKAKIIELIKYLKEKTTKTTEIINISIESVTRFDGVLEKLNDLIDNHNSKTENLNEEKERAFEKIKKHHLSTIWDEIQNGRIKIKEIKEIEEKVNDGGEFKWERNEYKTNGIKKLTENIDEAKKKISDLHKSVDKINKYLSIFLGREEIKFKVDSDEQGFEILRNGDTISNLSEGEKTAIAFVYFVIHLEDKDFKIKDGIVVIDDPISSLDSNSLFQAFSFMKNAIQNAKQIFIFTHNFEFFKLSLNWIKNSRESWKVYQIKNKYNQDKERLSYIDKIDQFIEKYNTEYEYLFFRLYRFNQNKAEKTIENVYEIPSIGRKVLETFLMFRIPTQENDFQKMKKIKFDDNKKTSIYKFFNDMSHLTGKGFHPSLIPEAEKNVEYLLEMIKDSFEDHYNILEENINNLPS